MVVPNKWGWPEILVNFHAHYMLDLEKAVMSSSERWEAIIKRLVL